MTSFRRIIIRSLLYGENHDKDIEKMAKAGQSAWETIVPLIENAPENQKNDAI